VSRWPFHGRSCRGGCSRVDHRLVGTAGLAALLVPVSLRRGAGTWVVGRWCLARCWVLKARAQARLQFGPHLLVVPLFPIVCGGGWRRRVVGFRPYVENYTVDASIFVNQVFKGARWMPWHQEPKKDVGICDKPRGVDNQTVIRGFPNGETRLEASPVTPA
jgi:hypothetical protein